LRKERARLVKRRDFIRDTAWVTALAGAGHVAYGQTASVPTSLPGAQTELIDTHVYVSRWPFRRLPGGETHQLAAQRQRYGVTAAWAGSFDALLHRDVGAVNIRLAEECASRKEVRLVPFGAINPTLPDWEDDLRRSAEIHHMPGIRLHPDFHGYTLADSRFARLVDLATRRRLVIQVALGMDDPRI